jgi:hypothetical protein
MDKKAGLGSKLFFFFKYMGQGVLYPFLVLFLNGKGINGGELGRLLMLLPLGKVAEIIENGSPMIGTVLSTCSEEFKNVYKSADMIISKGQANFETLFNEQRRIFFLFKVKCGLLSRRHNIPLNEYVLLDNRFIQKQQ